MPGYVEQAQAFEAAGVDEIWCVSVNDAFVMGAWARDQKTAGKVRMLADGDAAFAKATGLTLDLDWPRHGVAQQPLLHAGERRRSAVAECGSARVNSKSATPTRCWPRRKADRLYLATTSKIDFEVVRPRNRVEVKRRYIGKPQFFVQCTGRFHIVQVSRSTQL